MFYIHFRWNKLEVFEGFSLLKTKKITDIRLCFQFKKAANN